MLRHLALLARGTTTCGSRSVERRHHGHPRSKRLPRIVRNLVNSAAVFSDTEHSQERFFEIVNYRLHNPRPEPEPRAYARKSQEVE